MSKEYNFSFETIKFSKILFRINENFEPPDGKVPLKTNIDIDYKMEKKEMRVMVCLSSHEHKNTPFAFFIEAIGFFIFKEPISEELAKKVANINCAAIIFPYVREAAADVIRRAGFPPFNHGPINFKTYYEGRLKEEAKKTVQKNKKTKQTASGKKKQATAKAKTA